MFHSMTVWINVWIAGNLYDPISIPAVSALDRSDQIR